MTAANKLFHFRSPEEAEALLIECGCGDWIGLDEDRLGVSPEEHMMWLCTAPEGEIRDWCSSVRDGGKGMPVEATNRIRSELREMGL